MIVFEGCLQKQFVYRCVGNKLRIDRTCWFFIAAKAESSFRIGFEKHLSESHRSLQMQEAVPFQNSVMDEKGSLHTTCRIQNFLFCGGTASLDREQD